MFQHIVVGPIRSRCTGFGLRDWPSQISQSEGFIVDFSVLRGEVNFHHLFLLLYGLECSTIVGGWVVICGCRSMPISNIFGVCDGSSIFSIQILFWGADYCPDIFLTLSYMLYRSISRQLWDIFCPWLTFLLVDKARFWVPDFVSSGMPKLFFIMIGL